MSVGLTYKMATVTKYYPFWTNVFPRIPRISEHLVECLQNAGRVVWSLANRCRASEI